MTRHFRYASVVMIHSKTILIAHHTLRICWMEVDGGKIFKFLSLVQFLRWGVGKGGRGNKIPPRAHNTPHPFWGDLDGRGEERRGGNQNNIKTI